MFLTFFLSSTLFLTSCDDLNIFASFKERLEGRWYFEKVTYQKDFSFKVDNITSEYDDVYFEFEKDRDVTVEYIDADGNLVHIDGQWDRQHETDCDAFDDEDECDDISILQIALMQNGPLPVNNYSWEVVTLNSNKLVVTENTINGRIKYRLRKEY